MEWNHGNDDYLFTVYSSSRFRVRVRANLQLWYMVRVDDGNLDGRHIKMVIVVASSGQYNYRSFEIICIRYPDKLYRYCVLHLIYLLLFTLLPAPLSPPAPPGPLRERERARSQFNRNIT